MAAQVPSTIKNIRLHLDLMKIPLSLLITISAVFGFVLKKEAFDASIFLTAPGVFLLASGGAALNNYQDRDADRLMLRTKYRPLPSGQLSPGRARTLSVILMVSGLFSLYCINSELFVLGSAAVFLYNGVYTPLKSKIFLALIAGSLCGMIPPLIGWAAAGGDIFSIRIWIIMTLFGLWQLPHFWLIQLDHSADYQRSGIPSILGRFSTRQLEKIIFIWIVNFAVMLLSVPVLSPGTGHLTGWLIASTAISLVVAAFVHIFLSGPGRGYHRLFTYLNGSFFFVMITVIYDGFIGA
ncbi:MAG: protoheme IX farnesyltransferase [Desulfosalsimonadaceae bacterium]|nr:protoheme IX farnesyltransferase [Desulfosalsimonadaceae bacterium]